MEARLKQVERFDAKDEHVSSTGEFVLASDYDLLLADRTKAAEELARLRAHFNAGQDCERRDCEKALVALAGAGVCTPAETYGVNTSWAISDLCRGITTLAAELARERERHQELRQVVKEYRENPSHVHHLSRCKKGVNYPGLGLCDDRCLICHRADALLEPKPAPIATGESR